MKKMKAETSITLLWRTTHREWRSWQEQEIVARLKAQDSEGRYGRLELELDNVNEEDWSNAWKKYHPVRVGGASGGLPFLGRYQPQQGDVMLTLNQDMARWYRNPPYHQTVHGAAGKVHHTGRLGAQGCRLRKRYPCHHRHCWCRKEIKGCDIDGCGASR